MQIADKKAERQAKARASDGDTIKVIMEIPCHGNLQCKRGKTEQRIRLAEIDTPESKQPWGNKAKQALLSLVGGRAVRVEQTDIDRKRLGKGTYLSPCD